MKFKNFQFSMLALGALTLASCSDSDDAILQTPGANSIQFSTYVGNAVSRASSTDILGLQNSERGFGVFANWEKGLDWASGSQMPNFMNNQQVLFSGGQWTYSPLKYWPGGNEKVSFLAYAPYVPEYLNRFTEKSIIYNASQVGNDIVIGYALGSDITQQEDFLYASEIDKTSSSSQIQFQFKHALAKIGFKVTGWSKPSSKVTSTITINGISLSNTIQFGYFSLKAGDWTTVSPDVDDTHSFIVKGNLLQNNVFTDVDGQSGRLNTDDGFILTIPSSNQTYCIMIDYTVETIDESLPEGKVVTRNKIYRYLRPNFEKGKSYLININLGFDGNFGEDEGNTGGAIPEDFKPDAVDPNPEDPTVPTGPGSGTGIGFSATVSNWDGTGTSVNVPIGSSSTSGGSNVPSYGPGHTGGVD